MSFFDELGKKISDASRNAVEKTKDIAEITRLNSVIKENESQIDTLYTELGEAYYKSHCGDKTGEFADEIKKISALIEDTERNRKSVLELKGLEKCPYCGEEFPADETQCPECGKTVPRTAKKINDGDGDRLICSVCGYHMRLGSNFCIMCGTPVKKTDGRADASDEQPGITPQPKQPTTDSAASAAAAIPTATAAAKPTAAAAKQTAAAADSGEFSDVQIEDITQAFPMSKAEPEKQNAPANVAAKNNAASGSGLDATAQKAAAEISRMTAEKYAAKKLHPPTISSTASIPPARVSPESDDAGELTALPDFDAIDESLVVEEQTITDKPSKEIPFTPRRPVSRPASTGIVCKNCGAILPDGAMFCTKCGVSRSKAKKTPPVCPGCGAFVSAGMAFCPECGEKLV